MRIVNFSILLTAILLVSGCSQKSPECPKCPKVTKLDCSPQEEENRKLKDEISKLEIELEKYKKLANNNFPPNAKVGKCYARVLLPSSYIYEEEKVKVSDPTEDIITIPPKYKWVTKKVLVKEAQEKIIPTPAVYETVTKKILVSPAHEEWKKFTKEECMKNPSKCGIKDTKNLDAYTGEILCRVKVPDLYKTVTTKVLKKPAGYKKIVIPAVYKTIRVKEMVEPAKIKKIKHPAQYKIIKRKIKNGEERLKWEEIVCLKFIDKTFTSKLQKTLKDLGYYKGEIDGIYGKQTKNAVTAYQKDHALSTGALTIKTVKSLGLKIDYEE